jgi:hypothetical protein
MLPGSGLIGLAALGRKKFFQRGLRRKGPVYCFTFLLNPCTSSPLAILV